MNLPTLSDRTIAAGLLRKANLITYSRGKVTVLDRKKLEAASCDCYRIVRNELAHLVRSDHCRGAPPQSQSDNLLPRQGHRTGPQKIGSGFLRLLPHRP